MENLTQEQQDRLREEKVMAAYRDLFGNDPKTRSATQEIVWNDIQKVGYSKRPVFVPDHQGALCPMRAAYADGRRSVLLYIEHNVNFDPQVQLNK